MKIYEISIIPLSGFGTPIKGDTLFGHFCWQLAYNKDLVEGGIKKTLQNYAKKPFAVFSSAYPKNLADYDKYIFKRPNIPSSWIFKSKGNREKQYSVNKINKKKKWMIVNNDFQIDFDESKFINDEELYKECFVKPDKQKDLENNILKSFSQTHNTINRLTNTTGSGDIFAPYIIDKDFYKSGIKLLLFVCIDTEMTDIEKIKQGLTNIGCFGFGMRASSGSGRFSVCESKEIKIPERDDVNACYTLAPCIPEKNEFNYENIFFTPFTRFGKHGDTAARNPFKKPVIMADEAAVFKTNDKNVFKKPYIGKALNDISYTIPETISQGYAPYLPLKLENPNEKSN